MDESAHSENDEAGKNGVRFKKELNATNYVPELFSCLKLLGLLGTAFAHVKPLELGASGFCHFGELPRAGA